MCLKQWVQQQRRLLEDAGLLPRESDEDVE